jgi:hypothetical protein
MRFLCLSFLKGYSLVPICVNPSYRMAGAIPAHDFKGALSAAHRAIEIDRAGLARVTLEDAALAATALDWTLRGMDFADALHLARGQRCDGFASFDRQLAKAAKVVSGIEVRTP